MSISIKSVVASSTNVINTPSNVAPGDVLIVMTSSYSNRFTALSGPSGGAWNWKFSVIGAPDSNANKIYVDAWWKVAQAGDASGQIALSGGQSSYCGNYLIVVSGVDTNNPIGLNTTYSQDGTSVSSGTGDATTIKNSRRVLFYATMANAGGATNSFSPTSISGFTSAGRVTGTSGWTSAILFTENSDFPAGTFSPYTETITYESSMVGTALALYQENSAPVVSNITPSYADNRTSPVRINWAYSDLENDPQTQYEVSYRVNGSTGAYTTVTNSSANKYHDFSAGTFAHGDEYELRVRATDGFNWSEYVTINFTSGPNPWSYGSQVTSASTSGTFPAYLYSYDFDNGVADWESNSVLGEYPTPASVSGVTAPAGGTGYSMQVTWPTANKAWVDTKLTNGIYKNNIYQVTARVYVPAGSPAVQFNAAFCLISGETTTVTDAWQTITAQVQAVADNQLFVGIRTAAPSTSGQKVYVDSFNVIPVALPGGTYELQVRASDGFVYGPWSSIANFAVNTPPVAAVQNVSPKNVGGNINVTWTKSDANGDAQTKYKIRYRKRT